MPANYVLLGEITVSTAVASVTFSNIPQTGYTDLVIKGSTRTDRGDAVNDYFKIAPNGSSSSWTAVFLQGTGSGVASYTQSVAAGIVGETNGALSTANTFGSFELYIPNYASTTTFKSVSSDSVMEQNATTGISNLLGGLWSSNSAITSLTFTPGVGSNWVANSSFSLYGVAAFGTTPVIAPKATGGDIVVNDGTYWYHAFLSSGTFTPNQTLTCDYLVVAGGGSGGTSQYIMAGGGAGGLRSTVTATGGGGSLESALSMGSAVNYNIMVGAGGSINSNGSNSSISGSGITTVTSLGGGFGAAPAPTGAVAGSGGSGGGGCESVAARGTPGTGQSGQGYAGGAYTSNSHTGQGGGGGAGAAGGASGSPGGNGGNGVQITAFANATATGANSGYYAGGGGGGSWGGGNDSTGGLGGGGIGKFSNGGSVYGGTGVANTGGGGGGGSGQAGYGGSGGSGIVILRYTVA